MDVSLEATTGINRWNEIADNAIQGAKLSFDDGLEILKSPDVELPNLLAAAFRVRRHHFDLQVHLYYLKNAKSGLCPEDCNYCSQSSVSDAPIERYALLSEEKLLAGAQQAADSNARTYCIVASGRGPSHSEIDHLAGVVEKIKDRYGLHICCSLGLLEPEQAVKLKTAGVDRINHNLNTSRGFYDEICTTHSFDDRLATLKTARDAGMELCCGVIAGMGEKEHDLVQVATQLRDIGVESIPVNFLNAIDATPLEGRSDLNPRYCLKVLCLFRMANPATEIRIAGGRELHLRSMQAMGLYPANSLFVSDYLTTKGQAAEMDTQMIEDLGFEVITSQS